MGLGKYEQLSFGYFCPEKMKNKCSKTGKNIQKKYSEKKNPEKYPNKYPYLCLSDFF